MAIVCVSEHELTLELPGVANLNAMAALAFLWRTPGPHQVLVSQGASWWLFTGDRSTLVTGEIGSVLTLLEASRPAHELAFELLEREELTGPFSFRLARYLGFTDERLGRVGRGFGESPSPLEQALVCPAPNELGSAYPFALSAIAPRWSTLSPLFRLLALLAETEDPKLLIAKVEKWKARLSSSSPLWLKCRLLKASSHLHHLAGSQGKASFEAEHLRKCLEPLPDDPLKSDLLKGCEASAPSPDIAGQSRDTPSGSRSPKEIALRCLGTPQIVFGERAVGSRAWRTQKAISLFFYLALERRRVSADHLQEVIWPGLGFESGPNFLTTLSRVRKALASIGLEDALVRRQGRLYEIDHLYVVRSDKADFETRARSLNTRILDIGAARQALALYEGPFLEGLDDLWVVQVRRPLQELWFDLAVRTAKAELARGELESAYDLCGRMLKLEGAREEAHLCQVETLFAMGRGADAQEAFTFFEKVVRRSTGGPVSAEAQNAYGDMRQATRPSRL